MKKYSVAFILLEIVVMLVISCIPAVFVALYSDPAKNLTIPSLIIFIGLAYILHTCFADRILFPVAKKTMEKGTDKEGFVRSWTLYNKQTNSCASVLALDEVHGKIAYVSVHDPFEFQTADVKDITDISSGYIKGPFDGTRYVYYQFTCRNKRLRIPTFTARNMHMISATVVQDAIAEAARVSEYIQGLQKKVNAVPLPSTEYVIKTPDLWSDITVNEIPKYLGALAKKYNMHFKLVYDIEMAMFNEKCCLIFGIDRRDGVVFKMTFLEDGERVEYEVDNYLVSKFDHSDREGIEPKWDHMSQKIRNELIIIARGLDSKWSSLLQGDMSWLEGYKQSAWCSRQHFHIEERNRILDGIIAWQQGQ